MIEICALASGSNGNCYYVGNRHDAILVDAGISARQVLARMYQKNLDRNKVRGIFISHEHSDHVRGVRVLSKKLGVPVYFTKPTFLALWQTMQPNNVRLFTPGESVTLASFTIHTFLKSHDASEPCSFRVEHNGISVGVLTDIGQPCENVKNHTAHCHALFLETNYDEEMLNNGPYPYYLKRRILSDRGHLSNRQAFGLLSELETPNLQCIFLSHLSAENNTPEIAFREMSPLENRFAIKLTSRFDASEIFQIPID